MSVNVISTKQFIPDKILAIQNRMGIGDAVIFLPYIKIISEKFNTPVDLLIKKIEGRVPSKHLNQKAFMSIPFNYSDFVRRLEVRKKAELYNIGFIVFLELQSQFQQSQHQNFIE